jgi:hypothetical protein
MTYYVSYIQSTGELIGVSNVAPPVLNDVYIAHFDMKIDLGCMSWEPSTLSFITTGVLSKLEFLTKFTTQERIAIRASTNPIIIDFMDLLNMAENINLNDINTQNGVGYLAYVGIIEPTRVSEILK